MTRVWDAFAGLTAGAGLRVKNRTVPIRNETLAGRLELAVMQLLAKTATKAGGQLFANAVQGGVDIALPMVLPALPQYVK
jgi:hypothetical protein